MMQDNARTDWIKRLTLLLIPEMKRRAGLVVPPVAVSVSAAPLLGRQVAGMCISRSGSHARITISPAINDPLEVAATLVHELMHAALPSAAHDWRFIGLAEKLGLRITSDGSETRLPAFDLWAAPVLRGLPAYPSTSAPARPDLRPRQPLLLWLPWLVVGVVLAVATGRVQPVFMIGPLCLIPGYSDDRLSSRVWLRWLARIVAGAAPIVIAFSAAGPWGMELAATVAYCVVSVPLTAALYLSRPFAPLYRIGSFYDHTPPFLLLHRQRHSVFLERRVVFNRSSPAALGRLLLTLERSARAARVGRHLFAGDIEAAQSYRCDMDPVSGFIVESKDDGSATFACELLVRRADVFPIKGPVYHCKLIDAPAPANRNAKRDPLAPRSTEKGGARFAWPFAG